MPLLPNLYAKIQSPEPLFPGKPVNLSGKMVHADKMQVAAELISHRQEYKSCNWTTAWPKANVLLLSMVRRQICLV